MKDEKITGYGATPEEAKRDLGRNIELLAAERDVDAMAMGTVSLVALAFTGYLMLFGALLGAVVIRPLPTLVVALGFGAACTIGYTISYSFFLEITAGDFNIGQVVGVLLLVAGTFLAGSVFAGWLSSRVPAYSEIIERFEASALLAVPSFIRAPVMTATALFPTLFLAAEVISRNIASEQTGFSFFPDGGTVSEMLSLCILGLIQLALLNYRMKSHPLSADFTWYGARVSRRAVADEGIPER